MLFVFGALTLHDAVTAVTILASKLLHLINGTAQRESQLGFVLFRKSGHFSKKELVFSGGPLVSHWLKIDTAIVFFRSMALEKMSNRSKKVQVEASRRLLCAGTPKQIPRACFLGR